MIWISVSNEAEATKHERALPRYDKILGHEIIQAQKLWQEILAFQVSCDFFFILSVRFRDRNFRVCHKKKKRGHILIYKARKRKGDGESRRKEKAKRRHSFSWGSPRRSLPRSHEKREKKINKSQQMGSVKDYISSYIKRAKQKEKWCDRLNLRGTHR